MTDSTALQTLITGFGAFGEVGCNPSERLVKHLSYEVVLGHDLTRLLLPVSYTRAPQLLLEAMEAGGRDGRPFDNVLLLGVAAGSATWRVEQWGHNFDGPHPDVDGERPGLLGRVIVADAPDRYAATLPVERMVEGLTAINAPACLSESAGAYLCNHVLFRALHHAAKAGYKARVGFLHIPADEQTFSGVHGLESPVEVCLDDQGKRPHFPFAMHLAALRAVLAALIATE